MRVTAPPGKKVSRKSPERPQPRDKEEREAERERGAFLFSPSILVIKAASKNRENKAAPGLRREEDEEEKERRPPFPLGFFLGDD